jgi:hypothetical protein
VNGSSVRADLLHDAGHAINPAIDIGQVEGAFIQGMGWLTMEELWWNQAGKLMTSAPSTYKIPAVNDCPVDFRVRLFKNVNHEDTILRPRRSVSRHCCCHSRYSSRFAMPWRAWRMTASTRRSTRPPRLRRS